MQERRWHAVSPEDALEALGSGPDGINGPEAKRRLGIYGPNKIEIEKKVSPLKLLVEQFTDFLIIILIVAALVSAALGVMEGEEEYLLDAAIIGAIVVLNGLFGFFQNYKAEKSLEAVKEMATEHARVLRGGKVEEIKSTGIAPGDVVVLMDAECRVPFEYYSDWDGARVEVSRFAEDGEIETAVNEITAACERNAWVVVSHADGVALTEALDSLPTLVRIETLEYVGIELMAYSCQP